MPTWGWILISVSAIVVLTLIVLGYIMFTIAYHPRRRYDKWNHDFLMKRFKVGTYEDLKAFEKNTPYKLLKIKSFDQLNLAARLYQTERKKLVILLHGFETNIYTNMDCIKFYYDHSFDVLAVSLRAHLESEGHYISYGHLERRDLRDWIEFMLAQYPEYESIYIHGFSLGAATALRTSDVYYPKVKLIISDCGFASSTGAVKFSFKTDGYWYLPFYPIYFFSLLFHYFVTGAWVPKSRPIEHVRKSKYPILFLQSRKDTFISYKMAKAMYDACPQVKELAYFEAPHILAIRDCYDSYTNTILDFIQSNK